MEKTEPNLKAFLLSLLFLLNISNGFSQDILIIDYLSGFTSDQVSNGSEVYNTLSGSQTSVTRVNSIPTSISNLAYDQVWIFGTLPTITSAMTTTITDFVNGGGGVIFPMDVGVYSNNTSLLLQNSLDQLIISNPPTVNYDQNATYGDLFAHFPGYCHFLAATSVVKTFSNVPCENNLFVLDPQGQITTNPNLDTVLLGPTDCIGIQYRNCDFIGGQGSILALGDFNMLKPTSWNLYPDVLINYLAEICEELKMCPSLFCSINNSVDTTSICNGDSIFLQGAYQTTPGTYIDTLLNSGGCDTIIVTTVLSIGPALPNVTANASPQIVCEGDSAQITGSGATSYTWDNGVSDGDYVLPVSTTTYTVTGTDTNNCVNTDSVVVTVNTLPTVNAGTDSSICEGELITLIGSGAVSYTWDNGVTDGQPFNPIVGTITYTLIGTDTNNCVNTDSVVVTVNTLPTVNAGTDSSICEGEQIALIGSGNGVFTWDNGVTDTVTFIPPVGITTYTVTGTDTNTCTNTDSVIVTVYALPNVTANASASTICEEDSSQLTGSGATSYIWDNGVSDGDYVFPFTTTTYTVTSTDTNGCANTDTVVVTVHENPSIASSFLNDSCDLGVGSINLNVTGGNEPYVIFWSNGSYTEDLLGLIAGTYDVTVTDFLGCTESETFIIQNILDCRDELWLPNIFSPNNDGLNDKLYVRGTEFATTFLFTIYNRWGEKVFETTNPQEGWDGTYRFKPLNTAVFAYVVSTTFMDGSETSLSGTITLVK